MGLGGHAFGSMRGQTCEAPAQGWRKGSLSVSFPLMLVGQTRVCGGWVPSEEDPCWLSRVVPQAPDEELVLTSASGRQVSLWILVGPGVRFPPWGLPGGGGS